MRAYSAFSPLAILIAAFLFSAAIVSAGGKGGGGYTPPAPPANCCAPYYYCTGDDLYQHHADCSDTMIQTCPNGCANAACNP